MREILFRGKRLCNDKWMVGSLLCCENGEQFICCDRGDGNFNHYKVDPESVGQYTGVKDIHGNKVFEHDWVGYMWPIPHWEPEEIIMKIVFADGEFLMEPVKKDWFETWAIRVSGEEMEVVGNVFDNPELL